MILPLSYTEALVCLVFAMLLSGSWPNLQRLAGKWRYELFYWDFSLGILLAALLAALTLGSWNSKELTYQENFLIASYHKIGYGLAAGLLLNLGTLLFVAAVSVAPLSVVFPVGMGVATAIGALWTLSSAQGGLLLPLAGVILVLAAVVVSAITYSRYSQAQRPAQISPAPNPRAPKPPVATAPSAAKGITLSVLSGVGLGMATPLLSMTHSGDDGLAAYGAGVMIAIAAFVSTLVFTPFFVGFAVHGPPIQIRAYFKGSKKQHFCGLLAGVLWMLALLASLSTWGTLSAVPVGATAVRAFSEGAVILGLLWGWLGWREFKGGTYQMRMMLGAMFVLYGIGATLLAAGAEAGK